MPKNRLKEPYPTAFRTALWLVYDKRCAYTGSPISGPEEVVVDHVLPRRLANDGEALRRHMVEFGLPSDFDINGNLLNLVPTTSAFNVFKSDKIGHDQFIERFGPYTIHHPYQDRQSAWTKSAHELISHGLALAAEHYEDVKERQQMLECKEHGVKAFEQLPRKIREKAVAESYDVMSGEPPEFQNRTDLDERDIHIARSAVKIHCILPTDTDPNGPARLSFMILKIRDASIDFDQESLLNQLLRGFGDGTPSNKRPFIVTRHGDEVSVKIHHVRFGLPLSHLEQLCEIIDITAPHYLDAHERIERNHWRSLRFPYARRGFRLFDVPPWRWQLLLEYAHAHTIWKGNHQENIFDTQPTGFRIFERNEDHTVGQQVAQVHVEQIEPSPWNHHSDRMAICWDPIQSRHSPDSSGHAPWDAEEVHAKVEQLLHKALMWSSIRKPNWLMRVVSTLRRRPTSAPPSGRIISHRSDGQWAPTLGTSPWTANSMRNAVLAMHQQLRDPTPLSQVPGDAVSGVYNLMRYIIRKHRPAEETLANATRALSKGQDPHDHETAMRLAENFARQQRFVSPGVAAGALAGVFELLGGWCESSIPDDTMEMAAVELNTLYEYVRPRAYMERLRSRPW